MPDRKPLNSLIIHADNPEGSLGEGFSLLINDLPLGLDSAGERPDPAFTVVIAPPYRYEITGKGSIHCYRTARLTNGSSGSENVDG